MQRVRGDGPQSLHGTGRINADELQFLADVVVASFASGALIASIQWANGDGIANRPIGDAIAEDFNFARHFMTHDLRHFDALIHVAKVNVQVGSADAAMRDANLNLTGSRRDGDARTNGNRLVAFIKGRFHFSIECIVGAMRSALLALLIASQLHAAEPLPGKPLPIDGFAHLGFRVANLEASRKHYTEFLGFEQAFEVGTSAYFKVNDDQFIELTPGLRADEQVRMTTVTMLSADVKALHKMLRGLGLKPSAVAKRADGNMGFTLPDPVGNHLEFIQYMDGSPQVRDRGQHLSARRLSDHLQHTGVIIPLAKLPEAMKFYHEQLGMAEFWRMESKPGVVSLVKLIVPGKRHDIIELMVNDGELNRARIGSMNHINLVVPDIHQAHRTLMERGTAKNFWPRVNAEDIWSFNLTDPDGTRTEVQDLTKIPQARFLEQKVNGRDAYVLDNGWMRVSLLRGGGHIAEVRLQSGDQKKDVNPMRVPHYPTIDPHTYQDAKDNKMYGDSPHRLLSAGYMGHLLCFPFYGPPSSADEIAAHFGNHGEAPVVEWKLGKVETNAAGVTVSYSAELPLTQYRVERLVTLPRGLRQVKVEEWVENLAGFDRPMQWMQHATFGPPFVEPGKTRLEVSAAKGFANNEEFAWPRAGGVDQRVMRTDPKSGGYTPLLLDPERKEQFFIVSNPDFPVMIGYVFPAEGNPWLADWQENRRNTEPPWNGKVIARGIEFGNSPYAEGLKKAIERGTMFGAPAYGWIGAKKRMKTEYTIFLWDAGDVKDVRTENGIVVVTKQ